MPALDLLYPPTCPVCQQIIDRKEGLICPACYEKLSFLKPPLCKKCGREVEAEEQEYCFECSRKQRTFEENIGLMNYTEEARKSLAWFKYHNCREYADFYIEELWKQKKDILMRLQAEAVVPVPIHRAKQRKRGFNQAEILGRRLAEKLEIPLEGKRLVRVVNTRPQKQVKGNERGKNLEGAFAVKDGPFPFKKVILIDDIYTTGSTMEACTKALKRAGAEQVYGVTIAIGNI